MSHPLSQDDEREARRTWAAIPVADGLVPDGDGWREVNIVRSYGHYGGEWADKYVDGIFATLDRERADLAATRELALAALRALNKIGFEPLGVDPEASDRECLDIIVDIARAILASPAAVQLMKGEKP